MTLASFPNRGFFRVVYLNRSVSEKLPSDTIHVPEAAETLNTLTYNLSSAKCQVRIIHAGCMKGINKLKYNDCGVPFASFF
jgi:hypothetical protein